MHFPSLRAIVVLLIAFAPSILMGQTLTERLAAESADALIRDARQRGDVVRGAILFHQGNINCANCHRNASDGKGVGPDLSQLDDKVTDTSIVESILYPSKVIRGGYETLLVLTLDGKMIRGTIANEDDQMLVLNDPANVGRRIHLNKSDIEQTQRDPNSAMPADLVQQLKDRQQFLDLVRYVIDVREGKAQVQSAANPSSQRELPERLHGLITIQKYNCQACHAGNFVFPVAPKNAPNLLWSSANINPDYLISHIAAPHLAKSDSTMPDLLAGKSDQQRQNIASKIVAFLHSQAPSRFEDEKSDPVAAKRGWNLYHDVGCVACHAVRDESAMVSTSDLSPSDISNDAVAKYSITSLTEFLLDPTLVRSSGHMPNMQLTFREANDIANFMLQRNTTSPEPRQALAEAVEEGRTWFAELRCANCHSQIIPQTTPETPLKSLEELALDRGCLSQNVDKGPDFSLSEDERKSIKAALETLHQPLSPGENIDSTLVAFRCIACHQREGLGGVSDLKNPHFKTSNLNLGDQGRLPPRLTGVGSKLKQPWLRDVLVNGRSIRPYMNTRMPKFGEENVGHLVPLLAATDPKPPEIPAFEIESKKAIEQGHLLAGNKGLNCVACHTYQYQPSDTMPAVDLTEMAERLNPGWFFAYMRNPQQFSPNTVMPSFWPAGKAIRPDLEGTTEQQLESLWQYLEGGRQARAPSGVVRLPIEVLASENKAVMLRRSYPGIGKRGIGVGYPGEINIAFDSEQLRLGLLWRGKFIEASGVWRGQGSGNASPLGRTIPFPKGPELDSVADPWVVDEGRPPKHQFKGYQLDAQGRPTLLYSFDKVNVTDTLTQLVEDNEVHGLRREITFDAAEDTDELRFRIAAGKSLQKNQDGSFQVTDKLSVRIPDDWAGTLTKMPAAETGESETSLSVTMKLQANHQQQLVILYRLDP